MTDFERQREAAEQQRRTTEEAASWYLDQRAGMDTEQQAEFLNWLQQSPLHVAEYLAMARLHGDLGAATALDTLTQDELRTISETESAVVPLHPEKPAAAAHKDVPQRRTWAWLSQMAATAALLAVGCSAFVRSPAQAWDAFSSSRDALRNVALADGTQAELDRDSMIAVRIDDASRQIHVLRGGALFDVAHDAKRPLLVQLGANVLQDLGTVFDAHQSRDGSRITVISGHVKVWRNDESAWITSSEALTGGKIVADLAAGQEATTRSDGQLDLLDREANLAQSTAWLPADVQFQCERLSEVARRFNAYTSQPLVIDDARVGSRRISGRFHARDVEAFVAYLRTLPGVRVVHGANEIRLVGEAPVAKTTQTL